MVVANNRRDKKCRKIDDNFDNRSDAAVQCGAHRLMKPSTQLIDVTSFV